MNLSDFIDNEYVHQKGDKRPQMMTRACTGRSGCWASPAVGDTLVKGMTDD